MPRLRRAFLLLFVAVACVPVAAAKEGKSVVVLGPNGRPLVEPFAPFALVLSQFERATRPPDEPYVLVYPLMESSVPMRPGRWYPHAGVLCSGWRTGVEAGCVTAPRLRGWLGSGIATGLFRAPPTHLVDLASHGMHLSSFGNEATAIEMAFNQIAHAAAAAPKDCVSFSARWAGPRAARRPNSFCIAPAGGVFAHDEIYPLAGSAARFVIASAVANPPQGALSCNPAIGRLPCGGGMRLRVGYRIDVHTHCGILDEWFDGRLWVATPQLSDGSGNPPRGWGNPWQRGTVRLLSRSRAEFRAGRLVARFRPAARSYRSENHCD